MTSAFTVTAEEAGARLTVDLGAITRNYRTLAAMTAGAECAAVVKADAYGTGIEATGPALAAAGARTFFVAHVSEARRLRAVVPSATIYVLNGLAAEALDIYARHDLRPVLGSREEIACFAAFCAATGRRWPAAIHVDTGMNRLGLDLAEAALVAEPGPQALAFEPALLMSHLACADDPAHPLTNRQIDRFAQVRSLFPGIAASLANSAGCTLPAARHDLARPGIALYGGRFRADLAPLEAIARLDAPLIRVRDVRAGDTVGYGATWTARRPSRIGIISVGYADGYLRMTSASDARGGASVMVGGRACPLAGRVSMDLIAIDLTDAGAVKAGDLVTLIGDGIGVDDIAGAAGTIGYEMLTSLGRRYHRCYIGG